MCSGRDGGKAITVTFREGVENVTGILWTLLPCWPGVVELREEMLTCFSNIVYSIYISFVEGSIGDCNGYQDQRYRNGYKDQGYSHGHRESQKEGLPYLVV